MNDATGQATQSAAFELEAAVLLADYVSLDSALQEKYFAQLASGGTLLYETTQFSTSEVFLAASQNGDLAASINKPVSRLNSVFVTFVPLLSPADKAGGRQLVNTFQSYGDAAGSRANM